MKFGTWVLIQGWLWDYCNWTQFQMDNSLISPPTMALELEVMLDIDAVTSKQYIPSLTLNFNTIGLVVTSSIEVV